MHEQNGQQVLRTDPAPQPALCDQEGCRGAGAGETGLSTESARPGRGHEVCVGAPWIDRVGKVSGKGHSVSSGLEASVGFHHSLVTTQASVTAENESQILGHRC